MTTIIGVTTIKNGVYDITDKVRSAVQDSGISEGIVVICSTHTTAAVTLNEACDPDVTRDMLLGLDCVFTDRPDYRHYEGNSPSHLKTSVLQPGVTVIVDSGRLVLGRWQGIFLAEFDGPRKREVAVKVMQG